MAVSLTLGYIYIAKSMMRPADQISMVYLYEEIDRAGCGFFCGVKLSLPWGGPSTYLHQTGPAVYERHYGHPPALS